MSENLRVIVSVSGGKDSTTVLLLAREMGIAHDRVFCDTGHEAQVTYDYVNYLEDEFGPIRRIKADFTERLETRRQNLLNDTHVRRKWLEDGITEERIADVCDLLKPTGNPFLDLSLWKGRFPSTQARFCTQELKVLPIHEQVYMPLLREGITPESWVGVRADESRARANLPHREWDDPGYWIYRPILDWTAQECFRYQAEHGIKPNPMYLQGFSRVGCAPCIMCGKHEIRELANRYPEELERLARWEEMTAAVSKRGLATFFAAGKTPGEGDKRSTLPRVIEWAKTGRGGNQYDMFASEAPACSSVYGLCE